MFQFLTWKCQTQLFICQKIIVTQWGWRRKQGVRVFTVGQWPHKPQWVSLFFEFVLS